MSNRRLIISGVALGMILLIFNIGCRHSPSNISNQPAVCFGTEVLPLFQSNCAKSGCHNGQGESDLNLSNASGIRRNVVPGKPLDSRIYSAITDTCGNIMPPPPNAPLPTGARTQIYIWILQGADTTCKGAE